LAEFAAEARADTDLERLSAGMLETVHKTLQPKYSDLWIIHLPEDKGS
jgi:hypothetical protein